MFTRCAAAEVLPNHTGEAEGGRVRVRPRPPATHARGPLIAPGAVSTFAGAAGNENKSGEDMRKRGREEKEEKEEGGGGMGTLIDIDGCQNGTLVQTDDRSERAIHSPKESGIRIRTSCREEDCVAFGVIEIYGPHPSSLSGRSEEKSNARKRESPSILQMR